MFTSFLTWAGGLLLAASLSAHALTLQDALALAQRQAPEIAAARAAELSAQNLIGPADALPDPKLLAGLDDVPLGGNSRPLIASSMKMIGFMQEVPSSAKRDAERQMATAAWQTAGMQAKGAQLGVRRDISLAWLSLHFIERQKTLLQARQLETRRSRILGEAELKSGGGADAALAAELETARLADLFDDLDREETKARARLARWIGTDKAREATSGPLPAWLAQMPAEDALQKQPEVATSAAQAGEAGAKLARALAERNPDWGVELMFKRNGMGEDMALLQFSVDMPLFQSGRQTPRIEAARKALERSEAEHEARRAGVMENFRALQAERTALQRQLERQQGTVIPLTDKQQALALAGYQSGKGSAQQLVQSRLAGLAARMREIELSSQLASVATQQYFLAGGE